MKSDINPSTSADSMGAETPEPELRSWALTRSQADDGLLRDDSTTSQRGRFLVRTKVEGGTTLPSFVALFALPFTLKTLPKLSQYTLKQGGILHLSDACLRGIGQVFFCNSPLSGAMFLVAVLASAPRTAAMLVLGVVSATTFAKVMDYDPGLLASGIWGYNGALLGCALSVFCWGVDDPPVSTALMLVLGIIFGSCMTVIFTGAMARVVVPQGITPLTFPFQLATWIWLLGVQQWGHVTASHAPVPSLLRTVDASSGLNATAAVVSANHFQSQSYEPGLVVQAVFSGIAQTFLVSEWYCGVIMLLGISFCSMISAVWAFVGSAVGCIIAVGVGVNPEAIYGGLHGYNSCLCGMALGGFFLVQRGYKVIVIALFGIVASEIVTTSTSSAFSPIGLPALTWPFTVITWFMILATAGLPSVVTVAISSLTTAEDHRSRFLLSTAITSHFSVLAQFAAVRPASSPEDIARIEANLLPITLCAVAAAGKVEDLERLLSLGAAVDARDYDGRTALHLAAAECHSAVVRLLLENGADANAVDCFGGTPLEDAVRCSSVSRPNEQDAVISLLLGYGAILNSSSLRLRFGPQMCRLAAQGNTRGLQILLAAGCPPTSSDYDLRTACHLAAAGANGDADVRSLQMLLQYGGGRIIRLKDKFGNTPLDDAKSHSFNMGLILMEGHLSTEDDAAKGTKQENINLQIINSSQPAKETPFGLSEEHEFVSAVLELRGVEIEMSDLNSSTPQSTASTIEKGSAKRDMSDFLLPSLLCCAAASGNKELVEEFLDKMPASTVNIADYDGRTPLHVAVEQKQMEVVEVLLERGAIADLEDRWGISALWSAVCAGDESIASILRQSLDHKPSTDSYIVASYLCEVAAKPEDEDTIRSLTVAMKGAGFDPNTRDYDGRTALHIARSSRNSKVCELLLKFGANSDARDRWDNAAFSPEK